MGHHKWLSLAAVNVGNFVPPLDTGIMALILPTISLSLKAPISIVLWIPLTSLLIEAAFMPTFGRYSDSRGRKKFFIVGLVLFATGSFLAGNSLTIFAFEAKSRGLALGTHISTIYLGMTVGTAIAGSVITVTQLVGWRYVFYASGAIALLDIPISFALLKESARNLKVRMDWLGGVLFALALGSTLVYLSESTQTGFGSIEIYVQEVRIPILNLYFYPNTLISIPLTLVALTAVLAFALFVVRELTYSDPVIDFKLFRRNRIFASTNFSAFFAYVAHWSSLIVLSFLLQLKLYSPLTSALVLTVEPLSVMVFAAVGGWIASRSGPRNPSIAGLSIMTFALLLFTTLTVDSSLIYLSFLLALLGAGVGLFFPNNTNANLSSVEAKDRGLANGILGTMRHAGQSLSLAISSILIGYSALGACLSAGCTFSPDQYLSVLHLNFLIGASFGIAAILVVLIVERRFVRPGQDPKMGPSP
jgi:MFS family permease